LNRFQNTGRVLSPVLAFLACDLWAQPSPDTGGDRRAGQVAGYAAPKSGDAVDLSPWAYSYRKDSPSNPPETQWLWPHKTLRWDIINGARDIWYYDDSAHVLPKGTVLAGLLWEEPRDVRKVAVEFPKGEGKVPKSGEVLIACRSADSMWDDRRQTSPYSALVAEQDGRPALTPEGTTIFRFSVTCDPFAKLYVVYTGGDGKVAIPAIHAYGTALWKKESEIDVGWGFGPHDAGGSWDGRVEAYNGMIAGVDPLQNGNGVRADSANGWVDAEGGQGSRGVRLRLFQTDDPGNNRTLVTFWTRNGNFTVALRDLDDGPVLIPSVGVFLERAEKAAGARSFIAQWARQGLKTTRDQVNDGPEESLAGAMKRYYGDIALPALPVPPYEPVMKIDVPERQLVEQWRLGAWHLERWCQKLADGSYAIGIWWPYQKNIAANEGMTALGQESYLIIRALDLLGSHAVAEGGLDYWLFGEHARPFLWYADAMGNDALVNPYNGPNHQSPGYDQKHSLGHGRIMATAAFHYRLTRNGDWWRNAAPVLERASGATLRLREQWDRTQPEGAWSHGLMPPGNLSDINGTRLFYAITDSYYQGLRDVENLLARDGELKDRVDRTAETETVGRDLRKALDRSQALTQVVKVNDGTYRRALSYMPYARGIGPVVAPADRSAQYFERSLGALSMVESGVIGSREAIVPELLDIYEDRIVHDGQNGQSGYNAAPMIYLARDEVPMFLRGLYNAYAAELNPPLGYAFWEGTRGHGAQDKTFEEAAFLERLRMMLVMEDGDSLWLAKGTPRAWLKQGRRIAISHAPTFFGEMGYSIISDVENGLITAVVDLPSREPTQSVFLRLRHPTEAKIRSVRVNGQPWSDFDSARELVVLKGLNGRVTVSANYR